MSSSTQTTRPDWTDPEVARRELERYLRSDVAGGNGITQETYLTRYKTKVLRWMHCAPEGATFLVAPLTGWRGEPFTAKDPVIPFGCPSKALREARVARGFEPLLGGYYDGDGQPHNRIDEVPA